jgi:hypothetical protein
MRMTVPIKRIYFCEPEREHTPKHREQWNNQGVDLGFKAHEKYRFIKGFCSFGY